MDRHRRRASTRGHLLAAGLLLMVSGCFERTPIPPAASPNDEPTLAAQAEAVRNGRSDVVRLDTTPVGDEELAPLDGLGDRLRRINFSTTTITDAGLARLCRLENLEQLRLSSPNITDRGLAHVSKLAHLRFLHLLDAPVTDAGLESLHALENLESLYLDRTNVTDQGLGRLIEALPNVHLHVDEHHHPLDPRRNDHAH